MSDELFAAAQRRRRATRARAVAGGAPRGKVAKHMLSGLLICAECGSRFVIADSRNYACSSHINGGRAACANDRRVRREVIERGTIETLRNDLLDPALMRDVIKEARKLQSSALDNAAAVEKAQRARHRELEKQRDNLVNALAQVRNSPGIAARLAQIEEELAALPESPKASGNVAPMFRDAEAIYRRTVASLDRASPDRAREILRMLLGSIRMERRDGGLVALFEMEPTALLSLARGAKRGAGGSGGRI